FFFSSRRRHTRSKRDWSSDVCSSDLLSQMLLLRQPYHLFFPNSSSRFFFNFCIRREGDFLVGLSSIFSFEMKSITSADSLTLLGDKSNFSDLRFSSFSTSLLSRIEAILAFLLVDRLEYCFLFFTAFLIVSSIAASVFTVSWI